MLHELSYSNGVVSTKFIRSSLRSRGVRGTAFFVVIDDTPVSDCRDVSDIILKQLKIVYHPRNRVVLPQYASFCWYPAVYYSSEPFVLELFPGQSCPFLLKN